MRDRSFGRLSLIVLLPGTTSRVEDRLGYLGMKHRTRRLGPMHNLWVGCSLRCWLDAVRPKVHLTAAVGLCTSTRPVLLKRQKSIGETGRLRPRRPSMPGASPVPGSAGSGTPDDFLRESEPYGCRPPQGGHCSLQRAKVASQHPGFRDAQVPGPSGTPDRAGVVKNRAAFLNTT